MVVVFALWYGIITGTLVGYLIGNPSLKEELTTLTPTEKVALSVSIAVWPISLVLVVGKVLVEGDL